MNYKFRTRSGPYTHDAQIPIYRSVSSSSPSTTSSSAATHPMYGQPMYPNINQQGHAAVPPVGRPAPYHQSSTASPSSGLGIKIAIKPEYKITHPPHLSPQAGDIPRSNFQFDFELERKILAEAEKESPNWSRFATEHLPTKVPESTSPTPMGSVSDPIVNKYIAMGLSREAVPMAVANYGDNPTKVREFVNGYTLMREMGFSSSSVAEALVMHDNDTDKALAHFLNSSS